MAILISFLSLIIACIAVLISYLAYRPYVKLSIALDKENKNPMLILLDIVTKNIGKSAAANLVTKVDMFVFGEKVSNQEDEALGYLLYPKDRTSDKRGLQCPNTIDDQAEFQIHAEASYVWMFFPFKKWPCVKYTTKQLYQYHPERKQFRILPGGEEKVEIVIN